MNKAQLGGWWDHFRTVNGITMRTVQAIPKDKIDSHPCKDMRTPRELVGHIFFGMRSIAQGTTKGEIDLTEETDRAAIANIKTHEDLVRFATDCWGAADKAVQSLTDAQLAGMVKTPWGESFPGFVCLNILYDEHLHHRGQLYAYLRQVGVAPAMMWDFENNAPGFKPKQHQQA